jgi:hypothetical protein
MGLHSLRIAGRKSSWRRSFPQEKDTFSMPKKNTAVARRYGWLAANLGAAALIDGESRRAYNALLDEIIIAVKPKDIFEEIFVRDIVDLQWEVMRWRRLNVTLMNSHLYDAVLQVLTPICGMAKAVVLADKCAKHETEALKDVREILADAGLDAQVLSARTLARRIDHVERIDRLAAAAEMRRRAALHELRMHRGEFAKLMKAKFEQIEEGEFKEIEAAQDDVAAAAQ